MKGHHLPAFQLPGPRQRSISRDSLMLPCVPPALALVQAASQLTFRELVVAADYLITPRGPQNNRHAIATLEELKSAAAQFSSRGIRRLRAALEVARAGAESRYESLQHFELARLGIDTLELQAEIYDADGRFIGRFDAADRKNWNILEFDGEQHRLNRQQYLHDEERLARAREEGWDIMRTHKEDYAPHSLATTRRRMCEFLGATPQALPLALQRYFDESY